MKKPLNIILVVLLAILIIFVIAPGIYYNNKEKKEDAGIKEKLKTVMKNEPRVKDYTLTEAGVLYISVNDDGTRRDGFAEYLCQQMNDNQIKVDRVKIVKYGSQKAPNRDCAYGVLLGESWCK